MTTPKQREQLHKILDLVLDINCYQENGGNKPKAFFKFSGHTNTIGIEVYSNGWRPGAKPILYILDNTMEKRYSDDKTIDEIINTLEKLKEFLELPIIKCSQCGQEGVKEDMLQTTDGDICEECLGE